MEALKFLSEVNEPTLTVKKSLDLVKPEYAVE